MREAEAGGTAEAVPFHEQQQREAAYRQFILDLYHATPVSGHTSIARDIPEEARKAIRHWSQMIDYWAVDWDYKNDTFHNQWQSCRTRKDPKIELRAKYTYSQPGNTR